jgi:transposase
MMPRPYKGRHIVENIFCRFKDFLRVAYRRDKTKAAYAAVVYFAAAVININLVRRP